MESYIGCKIIQGEPMKEIVTGDRVPRPGYKVIYPGGYISWSPKEVFEGVYRRISKEEKLLIEA